jgi:AbrB family looped-hinge helix DNA binding protein
MTIATMTSKGQVTIPKDIRDALRLKAGDKLDFQVQPDGSYRIVPRKVDILSVFGMLKNNGIHVTVEEMNEAIRKGGTRQ